MSYKLKDDESLREGIRRTAREELDSALHELTEGIKADRVKAIHGARKSVKKERSLLRLSRSTLDPKQRRRENARLREAARALSASRDADVMLAALDQLTARYGDQIPKSTASAIRQRLRDGREAAAPDGELDPAIEALRGLGVSRARVDSWRLRRDGWNAISPGLRRTYRDGRRAARSARHEPTAEHLHEWRKRSKDLWYDLRLLQPMTPHTMKGHAQDAHELADRLGDDHDLAVLKQTLQDMASRLRVDLAPVLEVLDQRRAQLQTDAFLLGDRLYAERPKDFVRRLHRYWKAWRAQTAVARRRRRARPPSDEAPPASVFTDPTRSAVAP